MTKHALIERVGDKINSDRKYGWVCTLPRRLHCKHNGLTKFVSTERIKLDLDFSDFTRIPRERRHEVCHAMFQAGRVPIVLAWQPYSRGLGSYRPEGLFMILFREEVWSIPSLIALLHDWLREIKAEARLNRTEGRDMTTKKKKLLTMFRSEIQINEA